MADFFYEERVKSGEKGHHTVLRIEQKGEKKAMAMARRGMGSDCRLKEILEEGKIQARFNKIIDLVTIFEKNHIPGGENLVLYDPGKREIKVPEVMA
jgi:hypothetical protein